MKYVFLTAKDIREKIYTGPRGGRYFLRNDTKYYVRNDKQRKRLDRRGQKGKTGKANTTQSKTGKRKRLSGPGKPANDFDTVWGSMSAKERQSFVDSLDEKSLSRASDLVMNASDKARERIFDQALRATSGENLPDLAGVERTVNESSGIQKQFSAVKEACEKHFLEPKRKFFKEHSKAISAVANVAIMALVVGALYLGADFDPEDFGAESPLHNTFVERQGEDPRDEEDDDFDNDFVADDWDKAAREAREEEDYDEDEEED